MKRLLTLVVALSLTMVTAPAFAEHLQGSSSFGACSISPEGIKRINKDDNHARWVRVRALVHCDEQYSHGKVTIRLAGVSPDGAVAAGRASVDKSLDRPVTAGDHVIRARMKCNVKQNGEWTYSRLNLQVWMFAQVYRNGHWDRTTVSDRTQKLAC